MKIKGGVIVGKLTQLEWMYTMKCNRGVGLHFDKCVIKGCDKSSKTNSILKWLVYLYYYLSLQQQTLKQYVLAQMMIAATVPLLLHLSIPQQ